MMPRFLIAGTNSGCGKTTMTCAILQALANRGQKLMACKSGPDYIDPMFHREIIGVESCNLDLFLAGGNTVRSRLSHYAAGRDLTVIEGAMGYYDGIAVSSDASAWDLACETETPAILVVDARGSATSLCAVIHGFQHFQANSHIAGVLLNRISPMLYPRLKQRIEEACGIPVCGYLPKLPECTIESRHLGLLTAGEISDLKQRLQRLATEAERSIDLERLLSIAASAKSISFTDIPLPKSVSAQPTIAVARDEAFCFYYRDNLSLLQELGGQLVYFSPLHDKTLPPCDGLYLGGGYPELYAASLSQNQTMRDSIRRAIALQIPTIAECGGFLYLQQQLTDRTGATYPMCGVLPGAGYPTDRLQRFGYVTLHAKNDNLLCSAGDAFPAHEFHYWDVTQPGDCFLAQKPQSKRSWECGIARAWLYAGFPHLYFYANPEMAARFLRAAAQKGRAHHDPN
jgi:cobyrinic acid a,c-diamide synthase